MAIGFDDLVHLVEHGQVLELEVERPGIEAGGGQQVVHHAGEVVGLADDQPDHLAGRFGRGDLRVLFEDVRQTEDRGERGPQFVRGVGDELVTGLAEFLLGFEADLQFRLPGLALGELPVQQDDGGRHQEGHQEAHQIADPAHRLVGGRHLGGLVVALDHDGPGHLPELLVEHRRLGLGQRATRRPARVR